MSEREEKKISSDTQQLFIQFQNFQQMLQSVLIQKENFSIQKAEIENALSELEKSKEGEDIFKIAGPILIKVNKDEITKELLEQKESIELKLKSLNSQEEKLNTKIKELQEKLQTALMKK
ncbi:MAG: prefoldin subunit beta [Candidatus Aenigmatarchaeota archaeon]|nr:prefoldin subunit beta [Candidatus Aenigmarchaeota archaeon]